MAAPEKKDDLQSVLRFNAELVETVEHLQKVNQQLCEELNLYRRKLFGQSSERHIDDDSQLHLFDVDQATEETVEVEPEPPEPPKRRRRRKKSEKLPEHLRREIIEADVSEDQRMCGCCGEEMPIIGTDVTERLDLIPAELFVLEIRRHKRACGKCKDSIAQVPAGEEPGGPTTPVPGSDYGFGVYTQIITNKFADHLPLYRGEDIFARGGLVIPRNTQFGMLVNIATLLAPLVALMKSRVVSGQVIGVDDTSWGLYDIEDRAKSFSAEARLELRQQESVPIMRELHDWLTEKNADLRVLPKSKLGKAVRYALNQWDELSVYLGNGAIPIDNNETESELRRLTIGRKNWLFVGSHRGGEVAALMYSVVSSAARHHLDVWAYVNDCLRRLAGGSTDYEALLPDVWRASHPESIRQYRDAEQESRRLTTQQRRTRRREAKVA